ncbi:hypothetical protein GCM10010954_30490 [Halobacillus andaensis]|uniref:Uncharacterized protein n=1 Tax=Halobacillus andaensis TaxID=1176239 RepID=A0A917B990_HALAA|nr:hypothetical protein [Halobacillus andaensis]MBP2005155.1 small-conductance mechanosensitive channel [Halobacillus andaensis]GGF29260.1 hypothetical protein GCM10010954_30490 [Halobacillus andaensis]
MIYFKFILYQMIIICLTMALSVYFNMTIDGWGSNVLSGILFIAMFSSVVYLHYRKRFEHLRLKILSFVLATLLAGIIIVLGAIFLRVLA